MSPAQTPHSAPSPTPADVPILTSLARYHYLTAEQLRRLHYGLGVITYVRARLKSLVDAKLVTRLAQPHYARTGSSPNVFRLATRGYRFLEELGVPTHHLPDEKPYSYLYWRHTLALNHALIAAELLTRLHPQLTIHRLVHERELKRMPVKVQLPAGKVVSVIPDAYLQLHEAERVGPGYWHDLVWELDMGTTEVREFRQKVAALIAYALGPYRQVMGAAGITIVILTPQEEKRANALLSWIEAELTGLGQQACGEWFCVRSVDPAAVSPEELYLAPRWRQPFRTEPVPLLPLEEAPL